MTVLAYVLGVVLLALGIGASIALHELGHLLPAKLFGVRVPKYMIGFGPTIWSRQVGETEVGVKALPLGGFVQMIGMFPPRQGDRAGTVRVSSTGRFSQLADEARKAESELMEPGDEHRMFYRLPVWKKLVIMTSGTLVNLLIAAVLLTVLVTVQGIAVPKPGAKVASVAECAMTAAAAAQGKDCGQAPKTPAYLAGIQPADVIVSVDGHPIEDSAGVGRYIRPRVGQSTSIVVDRDGQQMSLEATPIRNTLLVYDDAGQPVLGPDGNPKTITAGFLGVTSGLNSAVEAQPLTVVPGIFGSAVWNTVSAVGRIPDRMVGVWQASFGGAKRDIQSPMSVVGVGRVAGEAASGKLDQLVGATWADRAWFLVSILASLNLMLFVFNLIPLMPFDGGQAAGALWEGIKRGWARLRRRPDPGYVDVAKALPITYAVSSVLIVMTLLLVYADLVNPIKLGG